MHAGKVWILHKRELGNPWSRYTWAIMGDFATIPHSFHYTFWNTSQCVCEWKECTGRYVIWFELINTFRRSEVWCCSLHHKPRARTVLCLRWVVDTRSDDMHVILRISVSLRFLQRSAQCSGCRAIPLLKTSHLSLETTGSFLPAVAAAVIPQRCNSNTAGISKINRRIYARSYPTILVQPDGSTIRIRYKEPYKIIKVLAMLDSLCWLKFNLSPLRAQFQRVGNNFFLWCGSPMRVFWQPIDIHNRLLPKKRKEENEENKSKWKTADWKFPRSLFGNDISFFAAPVGHRNAGREREGKATTETETQREIGCCWGAGGLIRFEPVRASLQQKEEGEKVTLLPGQTGLCWKMTRPVTQTMLYQEEIFKWPKAWLLT